MEFGGDRAVAILSALPGGKGELGVKVGVLVQTQNIPLRPICRFPILRPHQIGQFNSVLGIHGLGEQGKVLPLFPGLLRPLLLCHRCSLDSSVNVLTGGTGHFPERLLGGRVNGSKCLRRLDRLAIDDIKEGCEVDLSTGLGSLGARYGT